MMALEVNISPAYLRNDMSQALVTNSDDDDDDGFRRLGFCTAVVYVQN
jgi:hypothetical protein